MTVTHDELRERVDLMDNKLNLEGQRVLVTGSAGAIGGAAARACASMGAELILVDLYKPDTLAEELRASGSTVSAFSLDNSDAAAVNALIGSLPPLDALADCSGYYVSGDWREGGEPWEAIYRRSMDVNVLGPINLMRAVLPGMCERKSGRVALVGSMAGRSGGSTLAIEPAYAASKGALHTLVRYFARQVAKDGVVVNAIAPGTILTPLAVASGQPFDPASYPMKRLGEPEEIGWPVAFLCSKATSFMTGAVVDVNGGVVLS